MSVNDNLFVTDSHMPVLEKQNDLYPVWRWHKHYISDLRPE
jgi:hypothetical protein